MPLRHTPPQPDPSRMTPFAGHPIVVGLVPGQPDLVALTAAAWAEALGVDLFVGYADRARVTVEEYPDGTVRHAEVDPDSLDDSWRERQAALESHLHRLLGDGRVAWSFRYLAGRPDRALTHLARAVDASAFVVGAHDPGVAGRWHDFVDGSVAARLAHHQHRPVLVVPLSVVDWHDRVPWQ